MPGRQGRQIVRQKGKSVIISLYNQNLSELEEDNELAIRIAACLNYFEGVDVRTIQGYNEHKYHLQGEFYGEGYDYNRHGIIAFKIDERDSDADSVIERHKTLTQAREYLAIQIWKRDP